jgi:hypothetical protein
MNEKGAFGRTAGCDKPPGFRRTSHKNSSNRRGERQGVPKSTDPHYVGIPCGLQMLPNSVHPWAGVVSIPSMLASSTSGKW